MVAYSLQYRGASIGYVVLLYSLYSFLVYDNIDKILGF